MIPFLGGIPGIPSTSNRTAIIGLAFMVALLLTGIGCYLWGSHKGYAEAEAKGKAKYNGLVAEYKGKTAESLAKALDRAAALTRTGVELSAQLITTRAELDDARADITRRIPDATAAVTPGCEFGAAFVELCNRSAGLCAPGEPASAGSGGAAGKAAAPGQAGPGLCGGAPVTPRDLAAWIRDLGRKMQDESARAEKLEALLKEWAR